MNRPHAFIMKTNDIRFPKAPFAHKPLQMVIPDITFPIPFSNGNIAYLVMPANYSETDVEIVREIVLAHMNGIMKAKEANEKSGLMQYIKREVRKKSIVKTHY